MPQLLQATEETSFYTHLTLSLSFSYVCIILSYFLSFRTTKLSTFPDVLLLHVKKFKLREDWTPIKLDVSIDMPDTVDLSILRGNGLQPGEELLPETEGMSFCHPKVQFHHMCLLPYISVI